jgi:hypothetical protein
MWIIGVSLFKEDIIMTNERIFKGNILEEDEERIWTAMIEKNTLYTDRFNFDHQSNYDNIEAVSIPIDCLIDIMFRLESSEYYKKMRDYKRKSPWKLNKKMGNDIPSTLFSKYQIEYLVYDYNAAAYVNSFGTEITFGKNKSGRFQVYNFSNGVFIPDLIEVFKDIIKHENRALYDLQDVMILDDFICKLKLLQFGYKSCVEEVHKYEEIDEMKSAGFIIPDGFEI